MVAESHAKSMKVMYCGAPGSVFCVFNRFGVESENIIPLMSLLVIQNRKNYAWQPKCRKGGRGNRRTGSSASGLGGPFGSLQHHQPTNQAARQPAEDKAHKNHAYHSPCHAVTQKRGGGYIQSPTIAYILLQPPKQIQMHKEMNGWLISSLNNRKIYKVATSQAVWPSTILIVQ